MKRLQSLALPLLLMTVAIILTGCGGPTFVDRIGGGFSMGICGSIILILDIIALAQIIGTNWSFGRKAMWALIIVFFPVGGLLLWWFFGK
ncbi:MAG: hypothetical protein ACI9W4_003036 [Rhodothermales bacterium]|jgi:hypothetical protein